MSMSKVLVTHTMQPVCDYLATKTCHNSAIRTAKFVKYWLQINRRSVADQLGTDWWVVGDKCPQTPATSQIAGIDITDKVVQNHFFKCYTGFHKNWLNQRVTNGTNNPIYIST